MRTAVLTIALLFSALIGVLTVIDIVHHGLTLIGALAILIVIVFVIGLGGALRYPQGR